MSLRLYIWYVFSVIYLRLVCKRFYGNTIILWQFLIFFFLVFCLPHKLRIQILTTSMQVSFYQIYFILWICQRGRSFNKILCSKTNNFVSDILRLRDFFFIKHVRHGLMIYCRLPIKLHLLWRVYIMRPLLKIKQYNLYNIYLMQNEKVDNYTFWLVYVLPLMFVYCIFMTSALWRVVDHWSIYRNFCLFIRFFWYFFTNIKRFP